MLPAGQGDFLSQVEKCKCMGVLLTNDNRLKRKGKASCGDVIPKGKLHDLLGDCYNSHLRSKQGADTRIHIICKLFGFSLRGKTRNPRTGVKLLFLCIKRNELQWFRYLPLGGSPCNTNLEETPELLELYHLPGLGTTQDPPG